jgi:hypothetical protein
MFDALRFAAHISKDHQVTATLDALTSISASGSLLVAQHQSRSLTAQPGWGIAGVVSRVAGVPSPLAGEPWKSLWSQARMAGLLADRGWSIDSDFSLLESAARLGTPTSGATESRLQGEWLSPTSRPERSDSYAIRGSTLTRGLSAACGRAITSASCWQPGDGVPRASSR